jgi:hypothetical protein
MSHPKPAPALFSSLAILSLPFVEMSIYKSLAGICRDSRASKRGALFPLNKEERAPRVFCRKTQFRVVLLYIRVRIGYFPSREGGLCRPASISARANRRKWRDDRSEEPWGVPYSIAAGRCLPGTLAACGLGFSVAVF